ncbi:MAG: translocation/assembly module TamB domain-containing protein [Candidatus Eremiobacteraeota bacterium]|nr:translocation/assembly module TamB domain-containing protein [Candidatus Eremiobacteraeota bacterium]
MTRTQAGRWWAAAAIVLLSLALLSFWQRQAVAQMALIEAARTFAHVNLSFRSARFGASHATLENVSVTSQRNEPIAEIARVEVAYNLRDLFPGAARLYGLKALDVESPHVTIVRRPDGTFNLPIPNLSENPSRGGPPLILTARVRNGSLDVVNQSRLALPGERQLRAMNLRADATISTADRSTYRVMFAYGERPDRLYPVFGAGTIDLGRGYNDQHWTAAQLPVAAAVDFAVDSPSLQLQSGMLERVDAQYFGGHLAASAALRDGRIAIAGLSQPIAGVRGPLDVYDDGILTPGLRANLGRIPASISGGVYNLRNPRLRLAVRGSGDLAQLRGMFAQGERLAVRGPVTFGLLVEGDTKSPLAWISLRSPQATYAGTTLARLSGVLAFAGHDLDVMRFDGAYGAIRLRARGHLAFAQEPNAMEMLVRAHAPPGGTPYVSSVLPQTTLDAAVLATAYDPKAIAARGVLWGQGGAESVGALFDVDEHGNGVVGPLFARSGAGSLYARVALDRSGGTSVGILDARNFPLPAANGTLDATLAGSATRNALVAGGRAIVGTSFGPASAHGSVALRNGTLRGGILGTLGSHGSFGALLGGTARAPRAAGTVVIAGGRYRNFDVNGNAGLAYQDGTLDVHDAAVAIGPLFVGVAGTVNGFSSHGTLAPRYDLAAQVHSSDVGRLVATVAPQRANYVQGSIDADLHVTGTGSSPSFAGRVRAPEGSVNGLAFRNFEGGVSGDTSAVSVSGGRVVIGSSPISLSANASRSGAADVALDAPQLDLADLNDFFDTGDTFAGTGSLALRADVAGTRVLATSGNAKFTSARYRRVELGTVAARWKSAGETVATALSFGGPSGEVTLNGTIAPASRSMNLTATARGVDLAAWLPMLGYNVPITGHLDAHTTLVGTYPDLAMQAHAAVFNGTAWRMPIERFDITASAVDGRGRIDSATLNLPSMTTVASGSFGLHAGDPLALTITSTSTNVGDFLTRATGKTFGLSGALSSVLHVEGTRATPLLRDDVTLANVRYHDLSVPRASGEIEVNRHAVAVRNGTIDLEHGHALFSAAVPIALSGAHVATANGPIAGTVIADDVELSNFADLLPKGTQISGRIDGRVDAGGSVAAPNLNGALALTDGTFKSPVERSPITGIAANLALAGTRASLKSHALVGSGTMTATAAATLANLRHPEDATFTLNGSATNARLDLPAYFQGTLNGALAIVRTPRSPATMSGNLELSQTRLPLAAFLALNRGGGAKRQLPNVAFDGVQFSAGPDVRIQSANVDIGTTGAVRLGGTLDAPTLSGGFHSTGGSLSFYRTFYVERGDIHFDPSSGLIPDVNAVATTFVPDPATAVRLHVTGPATNMNLALASDPQYSREQILGLLVGAQQFGAVHGVASTGGAGFSTSAAARSLAYGQLNTAFTRNMLEPLSTELGSALGFTEVQITSDLQTGVGVNAVKALGKYVNAIYRQSFGYPEQQSVALEARPNDSNSYRITAYSATGPTLFSLQQPQPAAANVLNVNPATSYTPIGGSNGVSLLYLRRWW